MPGYPGAGHLQHECELSHLQLMVGVPPHVSMQMKIY